MSRHLKLKIKTINEMRFCINDEKVLEKYKNIRTEIED